MDNRTPQEPQPAAVPELPPLPMQAYRNAWAKDHGLNNRSIGKRLGLTGSRVSVIFRDGLCPAKYIDILRDDLGMPEHLLPEPSREKSGPLSAAEREALEAAKAEQAA